MSIGRFFDRPALRSGQQRQGASKTWQVIEREARQRGYETDDLTGFFNDLAAQVKQYTPGNAALTKYVADTCSTKVPEFGTALAPPT